VNDAGGVSGPAFLRRGLKDKNCSGRAFEFRDPNSVPPKEIFNHSRFVVAVLKTDDLRRATAFGRQFKEIWIGR
jgi:hypothetical protein